MDIHICPQCHTRVNRPIFFPRAMQQVFDYIWNHPGCTTDDIEAALYNSRSCGTLVLVHIARIRKNLAHTRYRLAGSDITTPKRNGNLPKRYTITEVTPTNGH